MSSSGIGPSPWGLQSFLSSEAPWTPIDPKLNNGYLESLPNNQAVQDYHFQDYRTSNPVPSECDTHHRGPPPSDSGYGTKHSESASVLDADQSQDTQSLVGRVEQMHFPHTPMPASMQHWPATQQSRVPSVSSEQVSSKPSKLICPGCGHAVKNKSELKLVHPLLWTRQHADNVVASIHRGMKSRIDVTSQTALDPSKGLPAITTCKGISVAFTKYWLMTRAMSSTIAATWGSASIMESDGHAPTTSAITC